MTKDETGYQERHPETCVFCRHRIWRGETPLNEFPVCAFLDPPDNQIEMRGTCARFSPYQPEKGGAE
jgi:hypothetical protein